MDTPLALPPANWSRRSPWPGGLVSGPTLVLLLLAAVLVLPAALLAGPAHARTVPAGTPAIVPTASSAALPGCELSELPPEAAETLDLIHAGGPFPYEQDGTTFFNREGLLPAQPTGYYREYTVPTPGSPDRGARRIVAGGTTPTDPDVSYYTADHYASFCEIGGTGDPGQLPDCALADLPAEMGSTGDLVRAGGPFPYEQDGTTYENREGLLPAQPSGYYRVYTVPTPGVPDRGDRRLVGGGAESTAPAVLYYTADHYASFCRVSD